MKIKAITILEILNGEVLSVHAFSDDPKGNQEAKDLFTRIYLEHKADHDEEKGTVAAEDLIPTEAEVDDIDYCIEGGVYDDDNGYQLVIVQTTEV